MKPRLIYHRPVVASIPIIKDSFAAENQGVPKYSLGIKNDKICYFNGTKWIDATSMDA